MYIARWHMTATTGHERAATDVLRKWQADVAERIGWRASAVRVTTGRIGVAQAHIELEARVDSLSDLEGAWADMAKNPYHQQHSKELESHIQSGSSVWHVLEIVENA